MAWVRIHDQAMHDLKIARLSDSAFRLWVRGLSYCQTGLTDGLIPHEALRDMGARRKDVDDLASTQLDGRAPLWETIEGFGFKVHDYLDWNDSRDVIRGRRSAMTRRQQKHRAKPADPAIVTPSVTRDNTRTSRVTSRPRHALSGLGVCVPVPVLSTSTSTQDPERESERKPAVVLPARREFGRLFLHRWQQDALIAILGPHAGTFGLDVFLDDLNTRLAGQALPANVWKFVQAALHQELVRRGLAVAAPAEDRLGKQSARLAAALANIAATEKA